MFVCSKTVWWCGWKKEIGCAEHPHEVSLRGVNFFEFVNVIDPSAGSPTETLLRLLLPRNVQI